MSGDLIGRASPWKYKPRKRMFQTWPSTECVKVDCGGDYLVRQYELPSFAFLQLDKDWKDTWLLKEHGNPINDPHCLAQTGQACYYPLPLPYNTEICRQVKLSSILQLLDEYEVGQISQWTESIKQSSWSEGSQICNRWGGCSARW